MAPRGLRGVCRLTGVATYDLVRELPARDRGPRARRGLRARLSPEFVRATTLIELRGGGETGVGEDVTYDGLDHVPFRPQGGSLPLAGSYTLESFFRRLDELDLWPSPPVREPSILYRRWAFESAALDLALRQAGRSLADVLGREAASAELRGVDAPDRPPATRGRRRRTASSRCSSATRARASSSTPPTPGHRSWWTS